MPCNSSYMEPNNYEKAVANTCKLLQFVKIKLGMKLGRIEIKYDDPYQYPPKDIGDKVTAELCGLLRSMDEDQINSIVYNAKDPTARKLADWWEEHQAADAKREEEEMSKKVYKGEDFSVSYEDSQEVRDAVFEKIMDYYKKHNVFSGESIMQMDNPVIDAPTVLSDIADDIIKFKVEYDEDSEWP